MKTTIRLKGILSFIKRYEKKRMLKKDELHKVNKKLFTMELHENLIKHYISRLERLTVKFLED